jgi:acyl-CoA thioesterase FadM
MTFAFEIYRGEGNPLVTAELVYVNADAAKKAAPLPEEVRERVRRYEKLPPQA